MFRTQDLRVKEIVRLRQPRALKEAQPLTEHRGATVFHGREAVKRILQTERPAPAGRRRACSIHDVNGALEYAHKLNALRQEFASRMEIVMRVYFEKPRTTSAGKA